MDPWNTNPIQLYDNCQLYIQGMWITYDFDTNENNYSMTPSKNYVTTGWAKLLWETTENNSGKEVKANKEKSIIQ